MKRLSKAQSRILDRLRNGWMLKHNTREGDAWIYRAGEVERVRVSLVEALLDRNAIEKFHHQFWTITYIAKPGWRERKCRNTRSG